MLISASIKNSLGQNEISVQTDNNKKHLTIPSKPEGYGSSVNGGELLFLSLATCFCNDVYREAAKRKMKIQTVDVTVTGEFGREGEPGTNITYHVKIDAPAHSEQEIASLISHVDSIAEIHNTLRRGAAVTIKEQPANN